MEPLRRLTRKDVEWQWAEEQDKSFEEVKKLVTAAPILSNYILSNLKCLKAFDLFRFDIKAKITARRDGKMQTAEKHGGVLFAHIRSLSLILD